MTRPRRVLMTTDTVGGVWTYSLELARALAPYEIEIVLAVMGGPPSTEQANAARALDNLRVHACNYRLEWMDEPWHDVDAAGRWLLELNDAYEPDLIHLNNYAHGTLSWRAPVLMVGHSCVLSWFRAVKGAEAPAQWNRYRARVRAGLRAADLVVAPSRSMLANLQNHYGPLHRTRVIWNGSSTPGASHRHKHPVILTAGRLWDAAKNVDAVVQVAPLVPWPIHVAGSTRRRDGREISLPNVTTLGWLGPEQLAAEMTRAAIYAAPARYEPFGLSALEAARHGCALVLGDIRSLREVWGDAAVWVAPDDRSRLRSSLSALIENRALLQRFAAMAGHQARKFTLGRMGRTYFQWYRQLLGLAPSAQTRLGRHAGVPYPLEP